MLTIFNAQKEYIMKHEFRDLKIWQKARTLNKEIYKVSKTFPKEELYGLTSQIRRASISVPSNISEGSGYDSDAQFLRYLYIALGSLCEVETQLYLSSDIDYISTKQLELTLVKTDELKRMIIGYMKSLKKSNKFNLGFLTLAFLFSIQLIFNK